MCTHNVFLEVGVAVVFGAFVADPEKNSSPTAHLHLLAEKMEEDETVRSERRVMGRNAAFLNDKYCSVEIWSVDHTVKTLAPLSSYAPFSPQLSYYLRYGLFSGSRSQ